MTLKDSIRCFQQSSQIEDKANTRRVISSGLQGPIVCINSFNTNVYFSRCINIDFVNTWAEVRKSWGYLRRYDLGSNVECTLFYF